MNKKIMIFGILGLFALALVSAAIWYGQSTDTLTINQPISYDGNGVATPCDAGQTCLGGKITTHNSADYPIVVTATTNWNTDVETRYVGILELTTKDTIAWTPTSRKVDVTYTLVGEEFEAEVALESEEVLVYAMDKDSRFVNYASVILVDDINGDLPYSSDWNADADPDYCLNHNTFDSYEHCNGAKLWVVKESDLGTPDSEGVYPLSWANMNLYLYETDLIQYFANANGEITVPANSFISFYPEYTVDKYLPTGTGITMTTTVK